MIEELAKLKKKNDYILLSELLLVVRKRMLPSKRVGLACPDFQLADYVRPSISRRPSTADRTR